MVIKSKDQLAHITSNCADKYYFILCSQIINVNNISIA